MKVNRQTILKIFTMSLLVSVLSVLCSFGSAHALSGNDFNAANIIDDAVFFDSGTMNTGDIQNFLNSKVSSCRSGYTCLKDYSQGFSSQGGDSYCGGISGGTKSAANIIFDVSRACGINPKTLIVLLQKEQALVTDTWPEASQYRSATGYGCPDTANCDAQYYGFFNQVYRAARQFKLYGARPGDYNYAAGRTSYIAYQVSSVSGCGGSNVAIQNRATAALYNYTPYQPNAAALGNLYSTGDRCSAYGNRNFWRLFNDWFGPTHGDGFQRVKSDDSNDLRQWVVYSGVKQYIPDSQTIYAWGLQDSTLVTMPAAQLAAITTGPNLDRLMRLQGDQTVYFLDNGKRYKIPWDPIMDTWNFRNRVVSVVSRGLYAVPTDGGDMSYAVKDPGSADIYMLDGKDGSNQTVIRKYQNIDIFRAWEGMEAQPMTVSSDFFGSIDNAVGPEITSTKVTAGGEQYQVVNSYRLWQTSVVTPLFSGSAQTVSWGTIGRLSVGPNVTQLVKSPTSPVYLLDNGIRYPLTSSEVWNAWSTPTQDVTIVNNGYLNLIPQGADLGSYIADVSGQLYILNRRKVAVPAELASAYRNSGSVFSASTTLMALYPTAATATSFIKSNDSSTIYFIDSSGKKRPLTSAEQIEAWSGAQTPPTELSYYIVNSITAAETLKNYVSKSGVNYYVNNGKKWTVSTGVATDWGFSNPQAYTDATLDRLDSAGALSNKVKDTNGVYYYIRGGNGYATSDQNIAQLWNITDATDTGPRPVYGTLNVYMLARFVRSNQTGDNRKFIISGGNWYSISDTPLANLGGDNAPITSLNPAYAPTTITAWPDTVLLKSGSNTYYVADGGSKRVFADTNTYNQWSNSGAVSAPVVSDAFLNLMPSGVAMQKSIKGAGSGVFAVINGRKQLLSSGSAYTQYTPYSSVSEALINSLSTGSNL